MSRTFIEVVSDKNLSELLPLVKAYQEFYGVTSIDEEKNRRHFLRFVDDHSRGILFLQRDQSRVIGFATLYFCFSSTRVEEVAVLNDLYVITDCRNKGYGKRLFAHAAEYAKTRGLSRIQWLTAKNNTVAQALYDTLGNNKSEWIFFTKEL